MPASTATEPKGGYNFVVFDYWGPMTNLAEVLIYDKPASGTAWASVDHNGRAFKLDKINEYTTAAGVTIDSLLVKDGYARATNDTYFKGRNAANNADIDIVKINSSNQVEFQKTSLLPTAYSPALSCSGSMTIGSSTVDWANYQTLGKSVIVTFGINGTLAGSASTAVRMDLPFTAAAGAGSNVRFCYYLNHASTLAISHGLLAGGGTYVELYMVNGGNYTLPATQSAWQGQFIYQQA